MDRDKWLAERRTGIGGSDAAAALGLSRWKTAYALWLEKRGQAADTPDNWSMRWGRAMEADLRQHYSDVTGRTVYVPQGIIRHPKFSWMIATPDGGTDDKRIVEIKTSRSAEGWGEPGSDQIPEYYALQVQHYLCVTGFAIADVVLGIYGHEPTIYHVEADQDLQEMLVEGERTFWRCVEQGEPPEPANYADVIARYGRKSIANAVVADAAVQRRLLELAQVRASIKAFEESEEHLKAEVMRALGESDALVDERGNVLCTWKAAKPSQRFDAKAFQAAHPALYAEFIKAGESSRRFLLKG